jgi:hypothetical protein
VAAPVEVAAEALEDEAVVAEVEVDVPLEVADEELAVTSLISPSAQLRKKMTYALRTQIVEVLGPEQPRQQYS